jgi:hypothetical protein
MDFTQLASPVRARRVSRQARRELDAIALERTPHPRARCGFETPGTGVVHPQQLMRSHDAFESVMVSRNAIQNIKSDC